MLLVVILIGGSLNFATKALRSAFLAASLYGAVNFLCSGQTPTFAPVGKAVVWQGGLNNLPTWSGGAFVTLDPGPRDVQAATWPAPNIYVSGTQGNLTTRATIPGAVWMQNRGAAHGSDGTLAICGDAKDSAGELWSYLAIFAPGAHEPVVVRTDPYRPTAVSVAPDGTLWTKGVDWEKGDDGQFHFSKRDRNGILRHFSRSGAPLGSALPQAGFRMREVVQSDRIAASTDRVGWCQYEGVGSGIGPSDGSYFEVSSDGAVSKTPLPSFSEGETIDAVAITHGGRVLLTKSRHGAQSQLYGLDRSQGLWQRVQFPASGFEGTSYYMLGVTGNTAAFWTNGTSGFTAQFVDVK